MTEPLSWQFVEAVKTQLGRIQQVEGFYTNIGTDVRIEPWAIDELVGEVSQRIYVFTSSVQRDTDNSGPRTKKDRYSLTIDVIVPTGQGDSHLNAHRALADIRRALAETDIREWAPKSISSPEIESQQIDPRPEGLKFVRVQVVLTAMVTETFRTN